MERVFRIEGDGGEIREREKRTKDPRERERLQAIRMRMSGNYTMEEIAEAVGRVPGAGCRVPGAGCRVPEVEGHPSSSKKKEFKAYPIGYFHLDIAEVATAEGKLYLFVAIDRTSKFAVARLVERADTNAAADFLHSLVEAIPYHIHTVLTDNGIQFADLPKNRQGPTALLRGHPFDRACRRHNIEHRLTKPNHPWTNGQVERMNRTIKEATVRTYHHDNHAHRRAHLSSFLDAYNFAKRLKSLAGLTPFCPVETILRPERRRR